MYTLGTFLQLPHDLDNIYRNPKQPDETQAAPPCAVAPPPAPKIMETEFSEPVAAEVPEKKSRVLHRRRSRSVNALHTVVEGPAAAPDEAHQGPSTSSSSTKNSLNTSRF